MDHIKFKWLLPLVFLSMISLAEDEPEKTVTLPNGEKVTEFTAIVGAEVVPLVLENSRKHLESYGVSFDSRLGWDFKEFKINPSVLKKNLPEYNRLRTTLRMALGSEKAVSEIMDPARKRAIQVGPKDHPHSAILLPPDTLAGNIKGLSVKSYDNKVSEVTHKIKQEMNHYLSTVEQANQYFTLQSRAELYAEADVSLKSANDLLRQRLMKDLGVSEDRLGSIVEIMQGALKSEKEKISQYSGSLRNAIIVAAVAPLLPLVLPLLPAAAVGAKTVALTTVASKASAVSGLIGLGMGYTKVVGHALIDRTKSGSADFQEILTDTLAKEGGEAVVWGVVGAVIPAGLHGVGIGYHAIRSGKISLEAAQLMVNLGGAIGFGLVAIAGGVQGGEHCAHLLDRAREAVARASQGEGSPQSAEAEFAEAKKACLDVGIDLAFFLVQSGLAGKRAYDAYLAKQTKVLVQAREAETPAVILQRAQNVSRRAIESGQPENKGPLLELKKLLNECDTNPSARTPEHFTKIEKLTQEIKAILEKVPDTASLLQDEALYKRDPKEKITNPDYLRNAVESGDFFIKSLGKPGELTPQQFEAMNLEMHRIATTGKDGKHLGYYGKEAQPGQIRSSSQLYSARAEAQAYAIQMAKKYGLKSSEDSPNGRVTIDGIDQDSQPGNIGRGHYYPSNQLQSYFAQGARLFNRLKVMPPRSSTHFVHALSDYYHLMVNARPFQHVNNSIFMTQVNVFLRSRGHSGVSHGFIDHLAHRFGYKEFRTLFRAHLEGKLPLPEQPFK